jgi:hypothetical protein
MSQGFKVFSATGATTLEVSDRLSRILYWSAASSGSAVVPGHIAGASCYGFINRGGGIAPAVTMSMTGSTLTWNSNIQGAAFVLSFK